MKTVLVTTCWLDNIDYLHKTKKWINYYSEYLFSDLNYNEIILLDNASSFSNIRNLIEFYPEALVQRFPEHLTRSSHLEYSYLWRAVYFYQELFKEYDKIIYCDNDFYLTSRKACDYVNNIKSGWVSFYCQKHNFPETGLQVITKDCQNYKDFISGLSKDEFIKKFNGQTMETMLKLTHVETNLIGDRHSEYDNIRVQDKTWDFSAQVPLSMQIKY